MIDSIEPVRCVCDAKFKSHWIKGRRKKEKKSCCGCSQQKFIATTVRFLFIDVSLHSMCHSLSVGTGNGVDMSIITGVAPRDKVRHSLWGGIVSRPMCYFLLYFFLSFYTKQNKRAISTKNCGKEGERQCTRVATKLSFHCYILIKTHGVELHVALLLTVVLTKVRSHPGHGKSRRCVVGNWACLVALNP